MKNLKIYCIALTFLILQLSCSNPTQTNPNGVLTLSLADVSCTEAWVELKTSNLSSPAQISFLSDNKVLANIDIVSGDTTVYINSLFPNETYRVQAHYTNNNGTASSNKIEIQTLDTTSSDFTWQTFTFGDPTEGSSVLNDVVVISPNDIYAVGEIHLKDSTGQSDPNAYNLMHWNGSEWEVLRLQFYSFCGQSYTGSYPTKSIIAFNENDIWITSGSQITHYNGKKQLNTECIPASVNKLWGISSENFYAVGNNGNIALYQNGEWSKIESGTTSNINDIWGISDNNGNNTILCTAYTFGSGGEKKLLRIQGSKVDSIAWVGNVDLFSVWFTTTNKIYAGGGWLYEKTNNKSWNKIPLPNYIFSIRGNGLNDIAVCGGLGYVEHFNGLRWHNYIDNGLNLIQGNYYSLSIKDNIICAVGANVEGKAVVVIGTR